MLSFLGESVVAALKLVRGQAQFRWTDMFEVMQACGPQALGIVALGALGVAIHMIYDRRHKP